MEINAKEEAEKQFDAFIATLDHKASTIEAPK